jgi:hypothetical protein
MSVLRMFGVSVLAAAAWVSGSAVGASEPASFTDRVQQSLGLAPRGAETEYEVASAAVAATPTYGEPASFTDRVQQSQGLAPRGAETEYEVASAAVATTPTYGEPASFIARVEESQGTGPARVLESADQLSQEQIRLVQRALVEKGYPTDVNGRFDEETRSSLMAFQRSQAIPVSGTLDSKTVEALGFDASQVTPVRGKR